MRWLMALLGVLMLGGGGWMGYYMFLQNKEALTFMGVMLLIAVAGLLLFGAVLKDERKSRVSGLMGLTGAAALMFALYSLWPMAVVNYQLLGRTAILIVITLTGLFLMYQSVRRGRKKE